MIFVSRNITVFRLVKASIKLRMASEHAYKKVPKSLKYWKCNSCDLLNPLFDTRCVACYRLQPFDDKTKSHLISLCKAYSDDSSSWNKLPDNAFKVDTLTKALTNKLYKISVIDSYSNQLTDIDKYKCGVLRIFNHRINLTLDQLLNVYSCFAESNIGTPIFGNFDIGQIEQFIAGRDLNDNELLHNQILSAKIANILSQIHNLTPKSFDNTHNELIVKLKSNIVKATEIFDKQVDGLSDVKKWSFVLENAELNNDDDEKLTGQVFGKIIENELEILVEKIVKTKSFCCQLVFSHNDYHSGNMILEQTEIDTEDTKSEEVVEDEKKINVKIIDYEYSGYNYRSFDFGNFFNELMIDNYYDKAPYFIMDEENYPSKEYRKRFLKEYMNGLYECDEDKLEDYVKEIELGSMLSHLWWSMWGVVESQRNDIDWDYMEYARQRLYHFFRVKGCMYK